MKRLILMDEEEAPARLVGDLKRSNPTIDEREE
jgi:hypothetical protein